MGLPTPVVRLGSTVSSQLRASPPQRASSVAASGAAEAGIVALAGRVKNMHLHHIYGNLVCGLLTEEAVRGVGDEAGTAYDFSITYDPAFLYENPVTGAVALDRSIVVLSPTLLGSVVARGN